MFDFRAFSDANRSDHLSWIFHSNDETVGKKGAIVDSSYNLPAALNSSVLGLSSSLNMHEYKAIEHGRSVVFLLNRLEHVRLEGLDSSELKRGWVYNHGTQEIDLSTGTVQFEWWALRDGRMSLRESTSPIDREKLRGGGKSAGWNWLQIPQVGA